ncbi:MAG TPA: hypothetical protein VMM38_04260 [Aridibacter sp.]|nr:hypothetical protein [Aridibacter sp.]
MENKPNIELIHKNMAMIWLALMSSQVIFIVAAFVAKPELMRFDMAKPVLGDNPPIVMAMALAGLMAIGASFFLGSTFYKRAVDEQQPAHVQTGMLIACAMCEAASAFGLVLGFAFTYQYFVAFIAAGMAGMAFHFPSRARLMDASYGKKL